MIHRFTSWLFSAPPETATIGKIIAWWEVRRIPYNLIIGSVGVVSFLLFLFFITHSNVLEPGEDAEEPLALIAAPILINICYTSGWVVEAALRSLDVVKTRKTGLLLFKAGSAFSLIVVLLPSVTWGFTYFSHVLSNR